MPYIVKPKPKQTRKVKVEDRQSVYQSTKWKKLRQAKLMQQPLCEICLKNGVVTIADDVHHIDSFLNYSGNQRLNKAFDFTNLMSVCKECHGKIHSGIIKI